MLKWIGISSLILFFLYFLLMSSSSSVDIATKQLKRDSKKRELVRIEKGAKPSIKKSFKKKSKEFTSSQEEIFFLAESNFDEAFTSIQSEFKITDKFFETITLGKETFPENKDFQFRIDSKATETLENIIHNDFINVRESCEVIIQNQNKDNQKEVQKIQKIIIEIERIKETLSHERYTYPIFNYLYENVSGLLDHELESNQECLATLL